MDRELVFYHSMYFFVLLLVGLSSICLRSCKGCSILDVRLVNGTHEGEGILEICSSGKWMKVCKLGLGETQMQEQVRVACRSLNFTTGFGTTVSFPSTMNSMVTSLNGISCCGYEVHLSQCNYNIDWWKFATSCGDEIVQVHCGYDYLFFGDCDAFQPSATLPSGKLISLDETIPYGNQTLNSIYVSSTNGMMMIGSSPAMNNSSSPVELDTVINLSIFQTEVSQSCPMSAVWSDEYSSLSTSSADFVEFVSVYVSNKLGSSFAGRWAIHTEWTDMCVSPTSSKTMSYQMTFITDFQASYAVFTYQCPESVPFYSPAIIGWDLSSKMTEFRYSQTNYSSRIACNGEGYYSLLINIEPQTNEGEQKMFNSNGSCIDAGFHNSSCCQSSVDWTLSCRTESDQGFCYCDGLCFEREDCCQDIHKLNLLQTCIPTCIEGSVAFDQEGRVLYCVNGVPSFISVGEGWNNFSASLVCQQLGYTSGLAGQLPIPANDQWYTVHDLSCEGSEWCLQSCTITKRVSFTENMSVASTFCSGTLGDLPFLCPKTFLRDTLKLTMVPLPSPVPVGLDDTEATACVHVNGCIIFGEQICLAHAPQPFPVVDIVVVAPYWDDISLVSPTAHLRYVVIEDTTNPLMKQVNSFLTNKLERIFDPVWILVVQWIYVCPEISRFCTPGKSNTFQSVVATDGFDSYAILSYQCGLLNWESSDGAVIGYSVNNQYYDNHMLSMSTRVNNISCQHSPNSVWNSVLYNIGSLQIFPILYLAEGDYMYFSLTDADSAAVELPSSILLGNELKELKAFIGTCGLITFGDEYIKPDPRTVPATDPFVALVAPFWDDIDLSAGKGRIRYSLVTNKEDPNFLHVENFLRKKIDVAYMLSWFLLSQWLEVCPLWDNTCNQTMPNTFQAIIAVNDSSTIAVFSYECGKLNWMSDKTFIGYSTALDKFEAFPVDDVNKLSCSNFPVVWANRVYMIGGIDPLSTDSTNQTPDIQESSLQTTLIVVAAVVPATIIIIVLLSILIATLAMCITKKKSPPQHTCNTPAQCSDGERVFFSNTSMRDQRYVYSNVRPDRTIERRQASIFSIDSSLTDQIPQDALVPFDQLRLLDSIGKGEFGIVYKAHMFTNEDSGFPIEVAAKTTRGKINEEDVVELMRESIKMLKFSHRNVMGLLGVCVDAGPTPYVILPFMSGGSLYDYLKANRNELVIAKEEGMDEDDVVDIQCKLLSMCLQIANGMEYLASKQFVHRDLAARNCMIDEDGIIKVADFGLSKSTYGKLYFREKGTDGPTKLPIKWMAIESIEDGLFTEKSDVWSFGVTCWEVFSGGKQPYGGINPLSIPKILGQGERMEPPANAACSNEIYGLAMDRCWKSDYSKRPTFSELVEDLSSILTQTANYVDFNSFRLTTEATNSKD